MIPKPDLTPKRADDPQGGLPAWKFRLGLAVKKWPIHVALLCAMVPVTVLGLFVLGAYNQIDDQQDIIAKQQQEIQVNRRALTFAACVNNNAQTRGLNTLNATLQAVIAGGPQQYNRLRPILERAGIDVDALRRAARENATDANRKLNAAKVRPQDCVEQAQQIEQLKPPKRRTQVHSNIPPGKK